MNPAKAPPRELARRRLLETLGIARVARRGRYAASVTPYGATGTGTSIVLVNSVDATTHPLLRAILAVIGVDPSRVRIAGTPVAGKVDVLLAIGIDDATAAASAPELAELARDPAAKRALWHSLRPMLRRS